jgi:hypothetical protein
MLCKRYRVRDGMQYYRVIVIVTESDCEFDRVSQSIISHEFTAIPDYTTRRRERILCISHGKHSQQRKRERERIGSGG